MASTPGRGAWTRRGKRNGTGLYARVKGEPRDGSFPEHMPPDPYGFEDASLSSWFTSLHYGVQAIQTLLNYHGIEVEITGEFRSETRLAVMEYQDQTDGLSPDGTVGIPTSQALLRPITAMAGHTLGLHPKWLWGLGTQESGFDMGAQGWSTNFDLGWQQHNTSDGHPTVEQAFDPEFAALASAKRFIKARDEEFADKGHKMAIDCAIMQHRSPVAARHLYNTGEPLGPESEEYVENVREFARTW